MRKDPTEFRRRFEAYKNGKMPYENGLPKYDDGVAPNIYRRPNGEYFYTNGVTETPVAPDRTSVGFNMFKDPAFWTYVDANGQHYTPKQQPTVGRVAELKPDYNWWTRELLDKDVAWMGDVADELHAAGETAFNLATLAMPGTAEMIYPTYQGVKAAIQGVGRKLMPAIMSGYMRAAAARGLSKEGMPLIYDLAQVTNPLHNINANIKPPKIFSDARFEMPNAATEAETTNAIIRNSIYHPEQDRVIIPFNTLGNSTRMLPPPNRESQVLKFADPYADLYTPSAGQETASPELASTLYPRDKYTVQDVPSKLVTRYSEMPNPRTGDNAKSIVNSLYNSYVKALEGYGKYGLKPPTPYIPKVGDDFVDVGFESLFFDTAHLPSAVEGVKNMPKGITEKTGVKMLQDLPHAQYSFLQGLPPTAFGDRSLLRGTGLEFTNQGLRRIGEPMNELLLPTWAGTDTDIDGPFGFPLPGEDVNALLERAVGALPPLPGEAPFPPQMDIDEYERYREIYDRFKDRQNFRMNLLGFGSKLLSPRYSKILSHAEDPDKYITDNFGKQILRNARENYFGSIKKLKLKDYARRVKEAERLNRNDVRFEIADDNRDRLQDAITPGKSFNTSIKEALELQNIIGNLGNWAQDASKDWILMLSDPNRPGWMLKSLMQGNPLEKQIAKDGNISVGNILNYINSRGSDVEKSVVKQVLDKKFKGASRISYRDFKHAVQDDLISYRHNPTSAWDSYGVERIGRASEIINPGTGDSNPQSGIKLKTYTFSSPRMPVGNNKHYDSNTLGHSRTFTSTDEPEVMYVLESQSDWGQEKFHPSAGRNYLTLEESEQHHLNTVTRLFNLKHPDDVKKYIKYYKEGGLDAVGRHAEEFSKDFVMDVINHGRRLEGNLNTGAITRLTRYKDRLKLALAKYLHDNFESRLILENLLEASRSGLKIMRYPTPETAALIEGYPTVRRPFRNGVELDPRDFLEGQNTIIYDRFAYPDDVEIRDVYSPEHLTILNKYKNFPKLFKKLYKNSEVRTVTDSKGRTWYEVDVPKNMRRKEWMYGIGAAITAGASKVLNPPKSKHHAEK